MHIPSHLEYNLNEPNLPQIKKVSDLWLSHHAITPNAIEGDPTLFIRTFGKNIAYFFGYELISQNTLQVPNVDYFTARIKQINSLLDNSKTIKLSFYQTNDGIETAENYLRKFVNEISLPIAKAGTVAIHDVTFHFGGIFFPQVGLVSGLIQAELILKFVDSLEDSHLNLKKILIDETVLNIDSSLGNFSYCYLNKSTKLNPLWILSRSGLSAIEYLNWFVRAVCEKYSLNIPQEKLNSINKKFSKGLYNINLHLNIDDFYRLTDSRISEINHCIEQIEA